VADLATILQKIHCHLYKCMIVTGRYCSQENDIICHPRDLNVKIKFSAICIDMVFHVLGLMSEIISKSITRLIS